MKILITGGCGFVGTNLAVFLKKKLKKSKIYTLDNFSRKGSLYNLSILKKNKIKNFNYNIAEQKIFKLPKFNLIIDCCAEASVEVSKKDIDRVINTNLIGTFNILKKVHKDNAKIIFLSSSRVYPIKKINELISFKNFKYKLKRKKKINEKFSLLGPKTFYGFTKLASEMLIEEFSYAFKLDYIINRFGVISGPLQFGKQDQGFLSLWVWKHLNKEKLNYIGYGGYGNQVRDLIHVDDLCRLIILQIKKFHKIKNKTFTVGGGLKNNISLKELTLLCREVTKNKININKQKKTSIYDIPYYISDNSKISRTYNWKPKIKVEKIVKDIYWWLSSDYKKIKKYFL